VANNEDILDLAVIKAPVVHGVTCGGTNYKSLYLCTINLCNYLIVVDKFTASGHADEIYWCPYTKFDDKTVTCDECRRILELHNGLK